MIEAPARRRASLCMLALIAVSTLACDTRPKIVREQPRGVRGEAVDAPTARAPAEEAPAATATLVAAAAPAPAAAEPAEKEEPRDFSKELLAQMGGAASCLRARSSDTAPRTLFISLG